MKDKIKSLINVMQRVNMEFSIQCVYVKNCSMTEMNIAASSHPKAGVERMKKSKSKN